MAGRLVKKGPGGERTVVADHTEKTAAPIKLEPVQADFQSGGSDSDVAFWSEGLNALEKNILKLGSVAMDAAGCEMENILADVLVESLIEVPRDKGDLAESGNHDRYNQGSALVKPPTVMKMRIWYGARPATTENTDNVAIVQTTDIHGNRIESGRKIGHQTTGHMKVSKERMEGGEVHVHDPSKYAWKQHENLDYVHPGGGKAKFLEDPFNRHVPDIVPRIGRAVGNALGGTWVGINNSGSPITVGTSTDRTSNG